MPKDSPADWQRAGIVDLATGEVGRDVLRPWMMPIPTEVRLTNGTVQWRHTQFWTDPTPQLLSEFVTLASSKAPERRFLEFVERWGGLVPCRHNLPAGHDMEPLRENNPFFDEKECPPFGVGFEGWYTEPIDLLRRFARQAKALLDIAAALHQDRLGAVEDWRLLRDSWTAPDLVPRSLNRFIGDHAEEREMVSDLIRRDLEELERLDPIPPIVWQRWKLADVVTLWLRYGRVRPALDWYARSMGAPEPRLGATQLFGNLAVQLLWAVAGRDSITTCSSCGQPYSPTRRPRAGEARFCRGCRKAGQPLADAKRRYRRRRRVLELRKEGLPWAAIARMFGHDVPVVQGWLAKRRSAAGKQ